MSYTNYYPNSSIFHASKLGCMATQMDILLVGENKALLEEIWVDIEGEIERLELIMSRFNPNSELYSLNRSAKVKETQVSTQLWEIINDCKRYNTLTNNYFDITLGYSSDLILNNSNHSIFFKNSNIILDLGAYGKGYALCEIKKIVEKHNIPNFLVNFGGSSVFAAGAHPAGDSWPIGVSNPFTGETIHTYSLSDKSLTTSGNSPSHLGHIINPNSGAFVTRKRVTTICCDDPILGEVLSTTAMLMEREEIESLLLTKNIDKLDITEL